MNKYCVSVSKEKTTDPKYQKKFDRFRFDTMEELAGVITSSVWSPIIWEPSTRVGRNFYGSQFSVEDHDDPGYPLEQCLRDKCDMIHVIGTTRNHQKEKNGVTCDRFRVVVPFTNPIKDPALFRYNMERIVDRYGSDSSCVDLARFYYPCTQIVSVCGEGYTEDVVPSPLNPETPKVEVSPPSLSRQDLPAWLFSCLRLGLDAGQRNSTMFTIGLTLRQCGYSLGEIADIVEKSEIKPAFDFTWDEMYSALTNGYKWVEKNK